MLFNSYIFIFIFLPLVLLGWYGFNHYQKYELANLFLAGMSLWFYGYFNTYYLAIILVSIGMNYLLSYLLSKLPESYARRKMWNRLGLAAGLILNLGILFYFKYYDFFHREYQYCIWHGLYFKAYPAAAWYQLLYFSAAVLYH